MGYKIYLSSKLKLKEVMCAFNSFYFFSIIVCGIFQFDLHMYFHPEHIPQHSLLASCHLLIISAFFAAENLRMLTL